MDIDDILSNYIDDELKIIIVSYLKRLPVTDYMEACSDIKNLVKIWSKFGQNS